jgi:uncharacterized repeat protein (TIGR03803 family)
MRPNRAWKFLLVSFISLVLAQDIQAGNLKVLYSFTGGADGMTPVAGVTRDASGNLYGTTLYGAYPYSGTVFELTKSEKLKVLYAFDGGSDGASPEGGVIRDAKGTLYGTTSYTKSYGYGYGTVYKVSKSGEHTVLYTFSGGADGAGPQSALIPDRGGNLYGTTEFGGDLSCGAPYGCGVVFRLSKTGQENVLYAFHGGSDGASPVAALVADAQGNLYGTASSGGDAICNCGVVFKLATSGQETVLYAFKGGADGAFPDANLIRDGEGALYGTTWSGGDTNCDTGLGCGVVFKVRKNGRESILHRFAGGNDGIGAVSGLVEDSKGNLYGTTRDGGKYSSGTVFKLSQAGKETVLHTFDGKDGAGPQAGLIRDKAGTLYGTTTHGGDFSVGTIYKLTP